MNWKNNSRPDEKGYILLLTIVAIVAAVLVIMPVWSYVSASLLTAARTYDQVEMHLARDAGIEYAIASLKNDRPLLTSLSPQALTPVAFPTPLAATNDLQATSVTATLLVPSQWDLVQAPSPAVPLAVKGSHHGRNSLTDRLGRLLATGLGLLPSRVARAAVSWVSAPIQGPNAPAEPGTVDLMKTSQADFEAAGSTRTNIDTATTPGDMFLIQGGTQGASFSAGLALGGAAGAGAHSLQRADGKFLIIRGNNTTSTFIYDPTANTVVAGPALAASAGAGAHSLQRPDGQFLIVRGNNATGTDIYDPAANTVSAGPALGGAAGAGAHSLQRTDGKFLIIRGNNATGTDIYDPAANTVSAGPALGGAAGAGAHSLQRPDGKFLIVRGNNTTGTDIYDPVANTVSAGPVLGSAAGAGAHALQRPDGKFLIIRGNSTTSTFIYDPVANTVVAGPALPAAAGSGAHSFQRADGTFLIIRGNNTNGTVVYNPVANTVVAGPALAASAGAGAHSLQRPDGQFLIVRGNNTTSTFIYDAGWFVSGQYISEKLSPSSITQWNLIAWTKTADNTVAFSVRTASTDTGLDSAPYRNVANGGSIGAGAGEIWLQVKADFSRTVPSYPGADTNVWGGEGHTFYQRTFAQPDVQDITLNYTLGPKPPSSLAQYQTDGVSVIPTAAYTDGTAVVVKFTMSSGLGSDTLTPQVEVRPLGTSFTNAPTHSGAALAYSGSLLTGSVTVTGMAQGTDYHWQARAAGTTGNGPWVSYGGNLETDMDFGISTSVSIAKNVTPSSGNAGTEVTYTITVSNTGAGVAKVTAITDTLPAEFTYVARSTGGTTTGDPSVTGQTLAWILSRDVTTATPITLSFRATASLIGGTYYNNAEVQGANFSTTSTGNAAPVTVLVPAVSVAKTASPSQVVPGEQVTYTITLSSIGNTTAAPSSIVDNLPSGSGFRYLLGSTAGGITADPKVLGGGLTLTWDSVPTIPPGGSLVFSFRVVTGSSSAQFYNSVTASGNFPQVSTGNTAPVFVGAAMLVSKTASPSVVPAATNVTYTITISNGSVGTDAGLTTVEDNLPAGFSYVGNSTTGAITANPQITGQTNLKWQGPWTVPGGGNFTFSFQAAATLDWGTYYDSVTIQGTNFLPVSTGPTAGVITVGWIRISKTVDNPTPGASEVVTYTIAVENVGPSAVPVTKLTDTIPTTFTYVSGSTSGAVSGDPSVVGNTMTWSGTQIPSSIDAGTRISFSFRTVVSSSADTYYDEAKAYVSWLDKSYTISTGDTAPVTVVMQPRIAISETYGDTSGPPGWSNVNVTGYNFPPQKEIVLYWVDLNNPLDPRTDPPTGTSLIPGQTLITLSNASAPLSFSPVAITIPSNANWGNGYAVAVMAKTAGTWEEQDRKPFNVRAKYQIVSQTPDGVKLTARVAFTGARSPDGTFSTPTNTPTITIYGWWE